jgi:hypothetical protein
VFEQRCGSIDVSLFWMVGCEVSKLEVVVNDKWIIGGT